MQGQLGILNVGTGDTKLTFDAKNPVERARAAGIVKDMLKRGFAIMVEVGMKDGKPLYQRAESFDPNTCEYIIAGGPDEHIDLGIEVPAAKKKRGPKIRLRADSTKGVAVSRSAGG
jgi:hypothetical protein